MKRQTLVKCAVVLLASIGGPAVADDSCSLHAITGKWLFATNIGRQMLGEPFPPDKDITAIGTMNIARDGTLSGTFDVTVEDFAFIPGVVYTGSVTVNPDCTGVLNFATSVGSVRTDSIAVLSRREVLGMSQDPMNLWTYQIRRIAADLGGHRQDD